MELLNVFGANIGANVGALMVIAFTIGYCLESKHYLNKRKDDMNEIK